MYDEQKKSNNKQERRDYVVFIVYLNLDATPEASFEKQEKIEWSTLAEYYGWLLQKKRFSDDARLVDAAGNQIVSGTIMEMQHLLDCIIDSFGFYNC